MTDLLPTMKQIQMWAWRRDNKRNEPSTVAEAAKRFKISPEQVADIVGIYPRNDNPYFYIVGDSRKSSIAEMRFEHDGE